MATKKTEKTAAVSAAPEVAMSLDEAIAEMTRLQRRIHKLEGQGDFGLVWEDMPEAVEQLLVSEVPVLASVPSLGVKGALPNEAPHVLIEGDNLHALHTLQATHRNSVDLIYIDPPYNTGQGFIYNDKIIDRENTYRHSAWLSFMEKRLLLARDLLKDTGLIFISIDDNEQPNLLLLCHQIFGEMRRPSTVFTNTCSSSQRTRAKRRYVRSCQTQTCPSTRCLTRRRSATTRRSLPVSGAPTAFEKTDQTSSTRSRRLMGLSAGHFTPMAPRGAGAGRPASSRRK